MSYKFQDRGFTLVETIVSVTIFSVAIVTLTLFITALYRSQGYSFEQATAINEARRGVEVMVREIREARTGADGSYMIEKADDSEFIFYSDIDKDGVVERVRYFLGGSSGSSDTKDCVTFDDGGSCFVNFSNFLSGELESAQVTVSAEGDLGSGNEYVSVFADGNSLNNVCGSGCNDCAGVWQGSASFDVTDYASDDSIDFTADASSRVNDFCDWQEANHAMKANFEFTWTETLSNGKVDFYKGVIVPTGWPLEYLPENENVSILSQYIRNAGSIFQYFDQGGVEIVTNPARPEETTLMRVYLNINVDPNRDPENFELESDVQLRNLKINL